ncbi:MAG TPA: outer membrane lipoprotein-sorting protein [Rectinemataceae bacterium]|nr:outer membrane lipoprotein-sorting protein [Rectinemataceae bacterium]
MRGDRSGFLVLCLALAAVGQAAAQSTAELGRSILEKADRRFYPVEGSMEVSVRASDMDGNSLEYRFTAYKKGGANQTIVWSYPAIDRDEVGMRRGDLIFHKQPKWPKPEILGYQAVFVDSPFSWGDILSSDLAADYVVTEISDAIEGGTDCYLLRLSPRKSGYYARIDAWIGKGGYETRKRVYYSASGEIEKTSVFSEIDIKGGAVTGFTVAMKNELLGVEGEARIGSIRKEVLPAFLFDPDSIGRIHAR